MSLPDYYELLGLQPNASGEDIRRAFRALAFRWHPDRNAEPGAAATFAAIHAAYAVLKDPVSRAEYNYKRYTANPAYRARPAATHTADIVREAKALHDKTVRLDPFRIDHDRLAFETGLILTPHNLGLLLRQADPDSLAVILGYLQPPLRLLPFPMAMRLLRELEPLAGRQEAFATAFAMLVRELRWRHYWARYKIWMALLAALLFCLLLFLSVR